MDVGDDSTCFACGERNPAGLRLRFALDEGARSARAAVTLGAMFQGWVGVVHGGIVATLLDEAMAWACLAAGRKAVLTAELQVRYQKPVPVDEEIEVRGMIVEASARLLRARAEVTRNGMVLASGEAKLLPVRS